MRPGRYCELNGIQEVSDLTAGLDFRKPEYRREVFLRFYEFHTKYRAHPGAVYYVLPALRKRLAWDTEQALWFAFINGNTQNPVTSYIIWREFPELNGLDMRSLASFLDVEWKRLEWDTDRRYWKAKFFSAVESYKALLGDKWQLEYFSQFVKPGFDARYANFSRLWSAVRSKFYGFGRLSAWSYIEYLSILGMNLHPSELFLRDIDGSKSHRNGLCKVLGRDDLDWRDGTHPYTPEILGWLEREADDLLTEAQARMPEDRSVNYLSLESTLCCYKSWHRPNRRYPNVYNDMFHDRIVKAEQRRWPGMDIFWSIREENLPNYLRLECTPHDGGLCPEKQNHYLNTGEVIIMDGDWPCFANHYNGANRYDALDLDS